MSPTFFTELENEVYHQTVVKGRTAVLVGMHLCGNLSERAIEFFRKIPNIHAAILSPCCLPKVRPGNAFQMSAWKGMDDYMAWSSHLKSRLEQHLPDATHEVNSYIDNDIHSIKNSIITAVRSA